MKFSAEVAWFVVRSKMGGIFSFEDPTHFMPSGDSQGFFIWWGLALIYTIGGLRAYYKGADRIAE